MEEEAACSVTPGSPRTIHISPHGHHLTQHHTDGVGAMVSSASRVNNRSAMFSPPTLPRPPQPTGVVLGQLGVGQEGVAGQVFGKLWVRVEGLHLGAAVLGHMRGRGPVVGVIRHVLQLMVLGEEVCGPAHSLRLQGVHNQ